MTSALDAYLAALRLRDGLPIAPCVACPCFAYDGAALCAACLTAVAAAHTPPCGCGACERAGRIVRALDTAPTGEPR